MLDRFKEPNEDDVAEFASCSSCDEIIYIGEQYLDHYGLISCSDLRCLIKMTGTIEKVAEDDEGS